VSARSRLARLKGIEQNTDALISHYRRAVEREQRKVLSFDVVRYLLGHPPRAGGPRCYARISDPRGVKRTFAWLAHNRRISKNYEWPCATDEAFVYTAMTRLMFRLSARAGRVSGGLSTSFGT